MSHRHIPDHHKNMRIAVGAIIHSQDKFLIVYEHNADTRPDVIHEFYKMPQGGIEPWEDEITALKREIKEELQIDIYERNIIRKIGQYAYTVNTNGLDKQTTRDDGLDGQIVAFYEVVLDDEQQNQIVPNPEEGIIGIEWIAMSKRYKYLDGYRMQAYNNALTDWYYGT